MLFLSPSTQDYNLYYDGSGSEEYYMNLIADYMEPYLTASGITFGRNDPDVQRRAVRSAPRASFQRLRQRELRTPDRQRRLLLSDKHKRETLCGDDRFKS